MVTVTDPPIEHWPETMDQAKDWIRQLRETYHREVAYRGRLERELHRQRDIVEYAVYWAQARGMHKTRWPERWKEAAKTFGASQGTRPVGVLPDD